MKAYITVLGSDRTGIIARVSMLLYEADVNILDITQTILGGIFTMVMLVDLSGMRASFDELSGQLGALARDMGLEIRMQRSEIFEAMHRV